MNGKCLTLFVVTVGLLLAALLIRNADVAWMALPFLAYLAVGILRSPAAETIRLEGARSVEQCFEAGERHYQVTVKVRNHGAAIDRFFLMDEQQIGMRVSLGQARQSTALGPGEETSLSYSFQAYRGQFTWKSIHAVVSDPLGLIETHLEVPAEAAIQVQPELARFQSLPVRPLRTLHLSGSIPARLGGSGTDFWGIREYQPGDSLRRLDWQHAARHPGQKYSREFEQEEIAEIGLILDARQSTDIQVGEDSLFEHSTRAAASLAEVFLRQGNRLSLLVYGDPMISVYPGYGKVQLNRILNTLTQVRTEVGGSLGGLQFLPVHMFSSRSIILMISPLVVGDSYLFPRLRAYGYQVVVVSPDPVDFVQQMMPKDLPARLSIRLSQVERQLEIKKITRLWIPVIDWQISQPLLPLVRSALSYSHLQRKR
jgi:uncharacterized protein (DUF58 family)